MIGFQRKIQFSVSNILMKKLFWKESETNLIGIYRKNKKTLFYLQQKNYESLLNQMDYKIFFQLTR